MIRPQHLTRYLTSKSFTHMGSGKPRATITMNRMKSALRTFFQFLMDAGYIKDNPARLIRLAKSSRKPPATLSEPEIKALLKTVSNNSSSITKRDHLIFTLLLSTGIRLGSLVSLNVEDVDIKQGRLRISGKNGTEQVVFLGTRLKKSLKTYINNHPATGAKPLFLSNQGNRIGSRQVQLRFDYWLKIAGITHHYTIHSLRHTFATRLYEKTGDLRLTQMALGHKRIATTEIYLHVSNKKLKRAVQSLDVLG